MKIRIRKKPIIGIVYLITIITLGLFCSGLIKKECKEKAKEIKKYYLIRDSQKMMDFRNGEFMAEGKLYAVDAKTLPELPGQYLEILRIHEEYRTHTNTYTTIDEDGYPHVHTETEHSWDEIRREKIRSERVRILGREFKLDNIDFYYSTGYNSTRKEGSDLRTVYYTYPSSTESGVLIGKFKNGVGKDLVFKKGKTIEDIIHQKESKATRMAILFWIIYGIAALAGFMFIMDGVED